MLTHGDLSSKFSRILRRDVHKSSLAPHYEDLKNKFGPNWDDFDVISQKDIALSQYLYSQKGLDCIHLALLEIFRVIEYEITKNIFYLFKQQGDFSKVKLNEQGNLYGRFEKSYSALEKFIKLDNKKLTLGEFSFILQAATQKKDVLLFSLLIDFIQKEYPTCGDRLIRLIKDLQFDKTGKYSGVGESFNAIRNRCAHPPSIAADNSDIFNYEVYDAVWKHLLEKPIQLLCLIVHSKQNKTSSS